MPVTVLPHIMTSAWNSSNCCYTDFCNTWPSDVDLHETNLLKRSTDLLWDLIERIEDLSETWVIFQKTKTKKKHNTFFCLSQAKQLTCNVFTEFNLLLFNRLLIDSVIEKKKKIKHLKKCLSPFLLLSFSRIPLLPTAS